MEWEFEDFKDRLADILKEISSQGRYFVKGRNMDWRHISGFAHIEAQSAEVFLEKALPRTSEWRLTGYYDAEKKVLEYLLFYHDAPGGESYSVEASQDGLEQ